MLTVRTRYLRATCPAVGWTSGQAFPAAIDPENLSETYTWWADSSDDVPMTERSQFLGDPRHNPYKDLLEGDPDFPAGYNPYFESLTQQARTPLQTSPDSMPARLASRWMGKVRADIPRSTSSTPGIVTSSSLYSAITGWSNYYAGIGNEFGADTANGYSQLDPDGS